MERMGIHILLPTLGVIKADPCLSVCPSFTLRSIINICEFPRAQIIFLYFFCSGVMHPDLP